MGILVIQTYTEGCRSVLVLPGWILRVWCIKQNSFIRHCLGDCFLLHDILPWDIQFAGTFVCLSHFIERAAGRVYHTKHSALTTGTYFKTDWNFWLTESLPVLWEAPLVYGVFCLPEYLYHWPSKCSEVTLMLRWVRHLKIPCKPVLNDLKPFKSPGYWLPDLW